MRSDRRSPSLLAQPTPLIGRERDVAAACQMVLRADVRLLTLTGPAGSGKTRLALAVLGALTGQFPDGAHFVDLSPLVDPALVINSVAQVLGVRDAGDLALADSVRGYLRDKRLLLVLDNFEQVLGAAPGVADLLAACPALKVVVTSRVALHLRWERELPILPLAVPDLRRSPSVAELAATPSVMLFVERARAVRPDFTLTDEGARAVAEICVRLDGLPLAIELAAARLNVLTVEALLARLDRRLQLLTGGARDQPTRHQALRAALAWSHDLLAAPEQALLRRLGVFVGGWTLEAAAAIGDGDGEPDGELLDRLAVLVDSNLVRQDASAGEPRYTMLETIREYAAERLTASGEAAEFYDRHGAYFLALAEAAEPKLKSGEQLAWLARLELEHDNLRAALARSLGAAGARPNAETALRLGSALVWFWWLHGHFGEGRRWMNAVLVGANEASPAFRAKALLDAGVMAYAQGDFEQAAVLQVRSLALWEEVGDPWGIAWASATASLSTRRSNGARERSVALIENGLTRFRQIGDRWHAAWCLWMLPGICGSAISPERKVTAFQEALDLFRQVGDAWGTGLVLLALAELEMARGNVDSVQRRIDQAAPLLESVGHKRGLGFLQATQGLLALAHGDLERAATCYSESLTLARDIGDRASLAAALFAIGKLVRENGSPERAARLFGAVSAMTAPGVPDRRLASSQPGEQEPGPARVSETPPSAPRHEGQAEAKPTGLNMVPAAELERELAAVSPVLGSTRASAAWKEGLAMTIDQAVAYGLNSLAAVKPASPRGQTTSLTRREREVAALLARGHTNRQIAGALVITERTAAAHVEHILAKLGFTTRTQIAVWAAEQKPIATDPR